MPAYSFQIKMWSMLTFVKCAPSALSWAKILWKESQGGQVFGIQFIRDLCNISILKLLILKILKQQQQKKYLLKNCFTASEFSWYSFFQTFLPCCLALLRMPSCPWHLYRPSLTEARQAKNSSHRGSQHLPPSAAQRMFYVMFSF